MGHDTDDDDDLEELTDALPPLSDDDRAQEALGIDDADDAAEGSDELDDGPEEIGLDVETLDTPGADLELDGDDDESYALDDGALDVGGEFDDQLDEDGWTQESEGAGSAWDDDALDDDDDDDAVDDDDGGLEGVEDPSLDDFIDDEHETTISIEGDDLNAEEDLERVELDLG